MLHHTPLCCHQPPQLTRSLGETLGTHPSCFRPAISRCRRMTKALPALSAVGVGRRLLSFSLVTGSLLVAASLAIHQPLQTSPSFGGAARGRIRTKPWGRLGEDRIQSLSPSILLASQSQTSSNDDTVPPMTNGSLNEASLSNREHAESSTTDEILSIWPRMDDLDKRMIKIALPCIANFAINPLIGAVDLFWVRLSYQFISLSFIVTLC